jgi:hypothetical protein
MKTILLDRSCAIPATTRVLLVQTADDVYDLRAFATRTLVLASRLTMLDALSLCRRKGWAPEAA